MLHVDINHAFEKGIEIKFNASLKGGNPRVVLFGPSGAGKTTVLRFIAGLEKPRKGVIKFGKTTWYDSEKDIFLPPQKRNIGFLFQNYALFDKMTVSENIGYALDGVSGQERTKKIDNMLELFQLEELRQRYPAHLSGGEKQKTALARTLCSEPGLLLLDEPFSAVDAPTRVRLRTEMRNVIRKLGIPIIVVTHDRTDALTLGNEIIIMDKGELLQHGPIEETLSRPAGSRTAGIIGMENVFHGKVVLKEDGIAKIQIGDVVLNAVDSEETAGDVVVCIRADEIILEKGSPKATSARNRLAGKVSAVEKEGYLVNLDVDCGMPVRVLITNKSFIELELGIGSEVLLSVKAQSLHVFPHV